MGASTKKSEIFITLPDDFMERINDAIADELLIAPVKWSTSINEEEEEDIILNAYEQLKLKVSGVSMIEWKLTQKVHIRLRDDKGKISGRSIEYPTKDDFDNNLTYFLKGDGFRVEDELLENLVNGENLQSFLMEKIESWARTAVFYGVGSYNGA